MDTTIASALVQDPSAFEPESRKLAVVTSENEEAALLFLVKVKSSIKSLEHEKETKCGPMLAALETARQPYLKAIKAFEVLKKAVEDALTKYRTAVELARQAEQRRAIEDHNRKMREAEEKAQKERDALEAARKERERLELEANREASFSVKKEAEKKLREAEALEQRAEMKVEKAEAAVQSVAPPTVVEQVQKTVTAMDGSKTTFKRTMGWVFANGVDKETTFYRDDPRFKDLDDRHFKFDPTTMNKRVKAGDRTIPGVVLVPETGTMTRQGKHSDEEEG